MKIYDLRFCKVLFFFVIIVEVLLLIELLRGIFVELGNSIVGGSEFEWVVIRCCEWLKRFGIECEWCIIVLLVCCFFILGVFCVCVVVDWKWVMFDF